MNAPLFVGDWLSLGMVHLELPPNELQAGVPFELDLFDGNAIVSLVFFTMRDMRLARAPALVNKLFYPFREQRFLNVRTYVRHRGEPGIHFIAEWISNAVCVHLGPLLYSLPYRRGRHEFADNTFCVTDHPTRTSFACDFRFKEPFGLCERGSRDEFVFERYAAFNSHRWSAKSFHVSHAPWEQCRAEANIANVSLLRTHFPWFSRARIAGANYSPGVRDVLMTAAESITVPEPLTVGIDALPRPVISIKDE
jgi:uncharacterized protein